MGLLVDIYRSNYDSTYNYFHGYSGLTVVNVEGPFEPSTRNPAALLVKGPSGDPVVVPATWDGVEWVKHSDPSLAGPMMGGTYASSSDSRWRRAVGAYDATPIHDRYDTWENHEILSR